MLFNTLVEAVLFHAKNTPDKSAVILKEKVLTYSELAKQMKAAASILKQQHQISIGDKVMITSLSKPEYLVIFLGIQYLHAITIPLDKVWREDTVSKLCGFIEPSLVVSDLISSSNTHSVVSLKKLYKEVEDFSDAVGAEDYVLPDETSIAEILFTTGTTGTPKGAMLTYRNIRAISENNIEGVGIRTDDVILDALPLCHSLGLREARMTLYMGATLVLQNGFSFPKELRTNIENFGCTGFVCVPAIMEQLVRTISNFPELFNNFRYIEIGAGSLSYALRKKLPVILPNTEIFNTWGSSETGGVIFLDVKHRQDKITALGKPVSSAHVKVIDETGNEIKATDIDSAGKLAVYGEMNMIGYYNLPEANEKTLQNGWFITNDLVYTDDDGFVYMLGRADDIINVGGEKVSPIEIENVAAEFDIVRDAACIGVADPVRGQVPILFVVVDSRANSGNNGSKEELLHFLRGRLEPFKLPTEIIWVNEIPRNRMKKLDRKAVRKLWEERKHIMNDSSGNMSLDFINLILSRHSVRNFTEQKVDRSILELLVKAAIQAPSGHNLQTWRFTVITNAEVIDRIKAVGSYIAKQDKTPFYGFNNPQALIIVSYDRRNDTGIMDASCATENILLAAHALGLGACWLNGLTRICNNAEIRGLLTKLGIPKNYNVCSMVALGYPANEDKIPVRKTDVVVWID